MQKNANDLTNVVSGSASLAARHLADEAQSTVERAGAQLSNWTESHGRQAAALMAVSGKRLRNLVWTRPLLCLTLVAGTSALAAYWLTRRYANNAQTDRAGQSHNANHHASSATSKPSENH